MQIRLCQIQFITTRNIQLTKNVKKNANTFSASYTMASFNFVIFFCAPAARTKHFYIQQTCFFVIITHIWSGPDCSMLISTKQLHMPHKALQAEAWHLALSHQWEGGIWYFHLFRTRTPLSGKHASVHTCLRAHLVPSIKSSYLNNRAQERKRADCTAASNKDKQCMTFNSTMHCRTQPRTGCLLSVVAANKKSQSQEMQPSLWKCPFSCLLILHYCQGWQSECV